MREAEVKVEEKTRRMSRRRWLLLGLLLLWVVTFSGALAYFAFTKDAVLNRTPVVNQVLGVTAPRFATAIYGIANPLGVAVSPDGQRIYASDGGSERVLRIFDANGNELAAVAPPNTSQYARQLARVAISKSGIVYVADINIGAVYMFSRDGDYLGDFKPDLGGDNGWRPVALAFDAQDNIYVADYRADVARILAFDAQGKLVRQFGEKGMGKGQMTAPSGIVAGADGRIYVSDSNTRQVLVYDQEGNFLENVVSSDATGFGLPAGVAIDSRGRLYVADTFSDSIQIIQVGEVTTTLFYMGSFGIGDGQFSFPSGVAVDGRDRIYVADRVNNRIQVWLY